MKKVISLLISIAVIMSLVLSVSAAGVGATVSASAASAKVGESITYTLSLTGASNATSGSVAVSFDDGLELVSGEFLKSGSTLATFKTDTLKGAIAFSSATDLSGNYFKLVLKAKTASANAQSVSFTVELKNGSNAIGTATASKSVNVVCKNHTFGDYTSLGNTQHKHVCSVCGFEEKANHAWSGAVVTKEANCKDTGVKTYTCTACNATKTETIAKTTAHKFGDWATVKEPTCTEAGEKQRVCSVCSKTETATIKATGHSFGAWEVTKEATCTEAGVETRVCSKCQAKETRSVKALGHSFSSPTTTKEATCTEAGEQTGVCTRCGKETSQKINPTGHKFDGWTQKTPATCTETGAETRKCSKCDATEERAIPALGHDFESPVVIKEATISSYGILEGKCKRCGETTQEKIPCKSADEQTGVVIEADEGVFAEGTQMVIEPIAKDDERIAVVKTALKDISGEFTVFDIKALLDSAVIQPNGKVKISLPIPEGYGEDVALYYISDDGVAQKLESTINDDGSISTELDHFSMYAICKLSAEPGENSSTEQIPIWVYIAIAAVLLAAVVTVILVVSKKKRA